MVNIVSKIKQQIINRSDSFEEQTKGTKDEYNIYREHIQYVFKYVCLLSRDKDVDHEVLELMDFKENNLDKFNVDDSIKDIIAHLTDEKLIEPTAKTIFATDEGLNLLDFSKQDMVV